MTQDLKTKIAEAIRDSNIMMAEDGSGDHSEGAKAVLKAIHDAGYRVVPLVPTEEMEDAADEPFHEALNKQTESSMRLFGKRAYASTGFSVPMWKAMIQASQPKTEEG